MHSTLNTRQKANLLFALWALVIVGFFSFSTRQEYYTIPALPGMALLVGGWMAKEADPTADSAYRRAGRISSAVLFVIVALGSVIGIALLLSSQAPAPGTDLADLLRKNPTEYDLSLGHFLDLTPQALGAFRGPLLWSGDFIGAGRRIELVPALAWTSQARQRGTCLDDGRVTGLRTLRICDLLADFIFAATCSGNSTALSAGET